MEKAELTGSFETLGEPAGESLDLSTLPLDKICAELEMKPPS